MATLKIKLKPLGKTLQQPQQTGQLDAAEDAGGPSRRPSRRRQHTPAVVAAPSSSDGANAAEQTDERGSSAEPSESLLLGDFSSMSRNIRRHRQQQVLESALRKRLEEKHREARRLTKERDFLHAKLRVLERVINTRSGGCQW